MAATLWPGPWYLSRNVFKSQLAGIADTIDDAAIDTAIYTGSRQIDLGCNRDFAVWVGARYFTAYEPMKLIVDDLLSVSELATDFGGRTYDVVWTTADYDLEPSNNPYLAPPHPYWKVHTTPLGARTFTPGLRRGNRFTGEWGFYKVLRLLASTVGGTGLDAVQTTLTVASSAEFDVGQTLSIGSEQCFVTDVPSGTVVTITRGVNHSTAAVHATSAPISVFTYPVVEKACEIQASRLFRRKTTPYGVVGTASVGDIRLSPQLDPDVQMLLSPLIKRVGG